MPLSHQLPTLFGRLTSLRDEHQRLHTHLERVRALCEVLSLTDDTPLPTAAERLLVIVEWQSQLSRHFAAEESSRYFGTLVTDRPELIPRIAELRAEHAAMLDTLELLIRLAGAANAATELSARTLRLIEQLDLHERAESALMQEFFEQEAARH
jgi:hypothetical protein